MIFTTNLPNINDIDDALLRPGRCYAVKNLRSLEPDEALRLAEKICGEDAGACARVRSQRSVATRREVVLGGAGLPRLRENGVRPHFLANGV